LEHIGETSYHPGNASKSKTLFLEVAMKKKRQEETFVGSPNLDNTWYVLLLVPLSFKRRPHFLSSCRFSTSWAAVKVPELLVKGAGASEVQLLDKKPRLGCHSNVR
jgi:hypothetical protein